MKRDFTAENAEKRGDKRRELKKERFTAEDAEVAEKRGSYLNRTGIDYHPKLLTDKEFGWWAVPTLQDRELKNDG